MELGNEISNKIRCAIKAKLTELGAYVDDELPDYIMVMVANKKDRDHMHKDLALFLGPHSDNFTEWLFGVLDKLKTLAVDDLSSDSAGAVVSIPDNSVVVVEPPIVVKTENDAPPTVEKPPTIMIQEQPEVVSKPVEIVKPNRSGSSRRRDSSRRRSSDRDRRTTRDRDRERDRDRHRDRDRERSNRYRSTRDRNERSRNERYNRPRSNTPKSRRRKRSEPAPAAVAAAADLLEVDGIGEEMDDAEHDRPLASVVQVTQRLQTEESNNDVSGPPSRSLLIRAMKEAEHSVAVAKSKATVIPFQHLPVTDLRRTRLSGLSVRQRLGRQLARKAKSERRSASRSLTRSRSRSRSRSPVENQKSEPKFIVTLKGMDRTRKRELETQLMNSQARRRSSGPVPVDAEEGEGYDLLEVSPPTSDAGAGPDTADGRYKIQLNDDSDSEVEASPSKQKRTKLHGKAVAAAAAAAAAAILPHNNEGVKIRERCRFWPSCRSGEACSFWHPVEACRSFPVCKFGSGCLYLHPACRFDAECSRPDCPFTHSAPRAAAPPAGLNFRPAAPTAAAPVFRPRAPVASLPAAPSGGLQKCRFYPKCTNMECRFFHPRSMCRFGANCQRKELCLFGHPDKQHQELSLPAPAALKWSKSALAVSRHTQKEKEKENVGANSHEMEKNGSPVCSKDVENMEEPDAVEVI